MKRFYKEAAAIACDDGFSVTLDGRSVRSPAKAPLTVPSEALAVAIAGEWASQGDAVDAASMPNMQFASTAIDRVVPDPEPVVETLLGYAKIDLLCYRAEEPATLQAHQWETWQPLLDWAARQYDAPLKVTEGVMPVVQAPEALASLSKSVSVLDGFRLSGLANVTQASGSLVLGLAVLEAEIDAEHCITASQLDERHQIARWGEDEELADRLDRQAEEIRNAARFLALVKS